MIGPLAMIGVGIELEIEAEIGVVAEIEIGHVLNVHREEIRARDVA